MEVVNVNVWMVFLELIVIWVRKEKIEMMILKIIFVFIVNSCLSNPCNQGTCVASSNCLGILCDYSCLCSNGTAGYYFLLKIKNK
jgi:hypothetical protein